MKKSISMSFRPESILETHNHFKLNIIYSLTLLNQEKLVQVNKSQMSFLLDICMDPRKTCIRNGFALLQKCSKCNKQKLIIWTL